MVCFSLKKIRIVSTTFFYLVAKVIYYDKKVHYTKDGIPLDGGVSMLIAAGVAYGAKKYRDYKKNKRK